MFAMVTIANNYFKKSPTHNEIFATLIKFSVKLSGIEKIMNENLRP